MKQIKSFAVIIFMILMASGCGKRYPDYSQFMNDVILAQENFLVHLDSASTAREMAAAVNEFSDRLTALNGVSRELREKYPESAQWRTTRRRTLRMTGKSFM